MLREAACRASSSARQQRQGPAPSLMKRLGGLRLRRLPPGRRRGRRGRWGHDCRRGRRGRRRDRRRNHGSRRGLGAHRAALRGGAEGWQRRCRVERGCTRARLRCRRRGLRRAGLRFAALTGRCVGRSRDGDPCAETCHAQQQSECQGPIHLGDMCQCTERRTSCWSMRPARIIATNRAQLRQPAGRLGGRRRTAGRSRARRGWRP
jgi:hypothetical protein